MTTMTISPKLKRRIYVAELVLWSTVGMFLALVVLRGSVAFLNFVSVYALVLALRVILDTPSASQEGGEKNGST